MSTYKSTKCQNLEIYMIRNALVNWTIGLRYFNLIVIFFQVKRDSMGWFHSIMCRMHHSTTKFFVRVILNPDYLVVSCSCVLMGSSNFISDFVGTHLVYYDVLPGLWPIAERTVNC